MAAGRPTVLAIDGVIREVVEASGAGLCVSPGDDKVLAEAITNLRNNPGLRKLMGRNARAHVEKHFNRDAHAQQFADVLTRLNDLRLLKTPQHVTQ